MVTAERIIRVSKAARRAASRQDTPQVYARFRNWHLAQDGDLHSDISRLMSPDSILLAMSFAMLAWVLLFSWMSWRWKRKQCTWSGAALRTDSLSSRLNEVRANYMNLAHSLPPRTTYHEQMLSAARASIQSLSFFQNRPSIQDEMYLQSLVDAEMEARAEKRRRLTHTAEQSDELRDD
jgi:hypothetical protein